LQNAHFLSNFVTLAGWSVSMNRIETNVTELSPRSLAGLTVQATAPCWVCQSTLSARAAFCHECGTIQAPREVDHFTRFGLDRRFDLDRDQLAGRYEAFRRVFVAERVGGKGPRQKQLAADHLTAVEEAHSILRDPVRRAEYLLSLLDEPGLATAAQAVEAEMAELHSELVGAADAVAIDRVALKARHGVEVCIRDLSGAFRQQAFGEVAIILARLTQLEDIAASARARRGDL
jgi:molecular chaperone HscB